MVVFTSPSGRARPASPLVDMLPQPPLPPPSYRRHLGPPRHATGCAYDHSPSHKGLNSPDLALRLSSSSPRSWAGPPRAARPAAPAAVAAVLSPPPAGQRLHRTYDHRQSPGRARLRSTMRFDCRLNRLHLALGHDQPRCAPRTTLGSDPSLSHRHVVACCFASPYCAWTLQQLPVPCLPLSNGPILSTSVPADSCLLARNLSSRRPTLSSPNLA